MKKILIIIFTLFIGFNLFADEVDQAISAAINFTDGKPSEPLKLLENYSVESINNPERRDLIEIKILDALPKANSRRAKDFFCRLLRIVGTKKSIPVLGEMLSDRETSHMARYALASMPYEEAGQVLHSNLNEVSEPLMAGIIDSLGDIRYQKSVPDLISLLDRASVANNATRALGLIGTSGVSDQLIPRLSKTTGKAYQVTAQALLRCAENQTRIGNNQEAQKIYKTFISPTKETHFILAGLNGLAKINDPEAISLLTEAIKSENIILANGAAAIITQLSTENIGEKIKDLLETAPPKMQVLLIGAISERGDKSASPTVINLTKSENIDVRLTAIQALANIGDNHSLLPVATIAASTTGHERNLARNTLANIKSDNAQNAIIQLINKTTPEIQSELVRAIAARAESSSLEHLFSFAKSEFSPVRKEAIRGIGILGNTKDLGNLMNLLINPKEDADRTDIESAVVYIFRRIEDNKIKFNALKEVLKSSNSKAKISALSLLGKNPNSESLALIRSTLKSENSVQLAAINALAKWPNQEPALDLFEIASDKINPNKNSALDAYISIASKAKNPTIAYQKAILLDESKNNLKRILAGMGQFGGLDAIEIIEPYLNDEAARDEAALALTNIARRIKSTNGATAINIIKNILNSEATNSAKSEAAKLNSEMNLYQDYVLDWRITGPYSVKSKDARFVFDNALAPEKDPNSVKWKKNRQNKKSEKSMWSVDLGAIMGLEENSAAYASTKVWVNKRIEVNLELGSDDHIKAWVNDKKIHESFGNRSLEPRQSIVPLTLNEGWNSILLKIVNTSGPWGLSCRIRNRSGGPVNGLKIDSRQRIKP